MNGSLNIQKVFGIASSVMFLIGFFLLPNERGFGLAGFDLLRLLTQAPDESAKTIVALLILALIAGILGLVLFALGQIKGGMGAGASCALFYLVVIIMSKGEIQMTGIGVWVAMISGLAMALTGAIPNLNIDTSVMTCPKCGERIKRGNKFCGNCGNEITFPIKKSRICPECKQETSSEGRFCEKCGAMISDAVPSIEKSSGITRAINEKKQSEAKSHVEISQTPENIVECPFCGEELEIEKEDKEKGSFDCPECGKLVLLNKIS